MEEFKKKVLVKYEDLIEELKVVNEQCRVFLLEATSNPTVSQEDMEIFMAFANDNHRRLQFAIAEKDILS